MRVVIGGGVLMLLLASLAGYFGASHYLFDLLSHFKLAYLVAAAALLIAASYRRMTYSVLASMVLIFINALEIAPMLSLPYALEPGSPRPQMKLLAVNVSRSKPDTARLLEYIKREQPHIIGMTGMSPAWRRSLDSLDPAYPYRHVVWRDDEFSMALLSRIPLQHVEEQYLSGAHLPCIFANIRWDNYTTDIVISHPRPAFHAIGFRDRNQELRAMVRMLSISEGKIILGDFNMTRFSPIYKQLIKDLEVKNTADGFGWLATWPRVPALMIDHILVDRHWRVLSTHRGPDIGSAHRPLLSEIQLGNLQ